MAKQKPNEPGADMSKTTTAGGAEPHGDEPTTPVEAIGGEASSSGIDIERLRELVREQELREESEWREGLSLKELAKESGVSQRTIRFYISKDLLKKPMQRGRTAKYQRVNLKRLEMIAALKQEGYTLERIHDWMRGRTDLDQTLLDLERAARERGRDLPPPPPAPELGEHTIPNTVLELGEGLYLVVEHWEIPNEWMDDEVKRDRLMRLVGVLRSAINGGGMLDD